MSSEASALVELATQDGGTRTVRLEKAHFQIGREPTCDIWIADASVSRRHARLESPKPGSWRIVDLASKNGTQVNGQRVELTDLVDGDAIQVGNCRMTLRLPEQPQTGAADLELGVVTQDTATVVVDAADMASDAAVPQRILSDLHDAMRHLCRQRDGHALLAAIADEFRKVLESDRVAVCLESEGQCQWPVVVNAAGEDVDGADLPVRLVPRVRDFKDSAVRDWKSVVQHAPQADRSTSRVAKRCFIFPVKAGQNRLGHVYVERRDPGWEPPSEKIEFLALLARQAALLLENMTLLEYRREAEKARREFEAARKIQLQMFPRSLALDERLDIAARNHPAFAVSGDYYDCQLVSPGRIAFVVADVMGHGLAAATLMTRLHSVFRTSVKHGYDLQELDRRMDEVMQSIREGEHFASGIAGLCDVDNGLLLLACAGHPWPSLFCGREAVPAVEPACTSLWGVPGPRPQLRPARVPIGAGLSLAAYTDGLVDSMSSDGRHYSASRLCEYHAQNLGRSAEEICEGVFDDVLAWADPSRPPDDDMTLFVIRTAP